MEQIGRYQILGELGRGAMGIVFRALDPAIGREVAIKVIRLSELGDGNERARLRERLFREAQSAGLLSHPNIVTIYDVGEEGEVAYIAMEQVNGPTLERFLDFETPAPSVVLSIFQQAAAGLDFAHKRGVVHRDIKPANIMLHENSVVKITDFGVAKMQSQQITYSGSILGTPNYMSPEQIQGQAVDGRADQFSLAVIAYEVLTGEKPFQGDSMTSLLYKIVKEDPVAPQRLNPSLSWPVETVLKRALSKSPTERYLSCSDFVKALENSLASSKNWKALPAGQAHDMPTVMEDARAAPETSSETFPLAAAVAAPVAEVARPILVPRPTQKIKPEQGASDGVPRPLRILRSLALIIVAAGLLSLLMVGALRFFSKQPDEEPAVAATDAPVEIGSVKKPGGTSSTSRVPSPETALPSRPITVDGGDGKPVVTGNAVIVPPVKPPSMPVELPADPGIQRKPSAAEKPGPAAGNETETNISTTPPGASVVFDNNPELACNSPCSMPLSRGRHTLRASLPSYRTGLRIFEVPKDPQVFVYMEKASGTLMVKSDPPGAEIFVDGERRGEKTPALLYLGTGPHQVEIRKEGLKTYTEEVDVKDAGYTHVDVNWNGKSGT